MQMLTREQSKNKSSVTGQTEESGDKIKRENCQKTLIKRNSSAVDPSSDDPDEKTLIKRNNSLECLLNYARRLIISH